MSTSIHFARTLRPKKLSEVIGQEIVSNMLSNSIYLNRYFPVYLFYGQRGCGKTTVARILATMINCSQLESFQADPRSTQLPCTTCPSCIASREGCHPDFIEIDAASNTGVDNVRAILESAQYLPLMGRKKIYLIDEAHMLSKAAFNALLKMLEEPPVNALFILATTEIAKIPITVKSRSFLGVFNAPSHAVVCEYITRVAENHSISITSDAIRMLVTKADRCIRDALNLLEQLASLHDQITIDVISHTFGIADTSHIVQIIQSIIQENPSSLFSALEKCNFYDTNPTTFWLSLCEGFSCLSRSFCGSGIHSSFMPHEAEIDALSKQTASPRLAFINTQFWLAEKILNTTTNKHLFIEHFLSSMCNAHTQSLLKNAPSESISLATASTQQPDSIGKKIIHESKQTPQPTLVHPKKTPELKNDASSEPTDLPAEWLTVINDLSNEPDKIPYSILRKAHPEISETRLLVYIDNFNSFLDEQLSERKTIWHKKILTAFPSVKTIEFQSKSKEPKKNPTPQKNDSSASPGQPTLSARNLAEGPTTDLIMKYFPGKLI
ncbi:DNA polymerase III subunit gamma/tau [Candidatus Dependentiae bacterium]|nr:DNA polymerase III subunit gamma/tau [Candidatus Dependentiae bacterium]